jgi:hypothetical protein
MVRKDFTERYVVAASMAAVIAKHPWARSVTDYGAVEILDAPITATTEQLTDVHGPIVAGGHD